MQGILTEEAFSCFLKEYAGDRVSLALLEFWGRHPQAKFSRGAISCALDCKKLDVDRALKVMLEAGLVDTYIQNGVTFYSLTADEGKRQPILELSAFGWDQLQLMLRHINQRGQAELGATLSGRQPKYESQSIA